MNSLLGYGASLAKDFHGFVKEVAEEIQTVASTEQNADGNDELNDEERALEAELKHQLLELSDDEHGGSEIRTLSKQEMQDLASQDEQANAKAANAEGASAEQPEDGKPDEDAKYDELHTKYAQLKQNYRRCMGLVEKYQIHNKSLKESLNKLLTINEQQQEQLKETEKVKGELNRKIIRLQSQIKYLKTHKPKPKQQVRFEEPTAMELQAHDEEKMKMEERRDDTPNLSETDSDLEEDEAAGSESTDKVAALPPHSNPALRVIKSANAQLNKTSSAMRLQKPPPMSIKRSVSMRAVRDDDEIISKPEMHKLKQTLQKASTNMKELKQRYQKAKDDLSRKTAEFDQLKSQYVTLKISSSKEIKELKAQCVTLKLSNPTKAKQAHLPKSTHREQPAQGFSKEVQMILDAKLRLECTPDVINPLQLEMISILNGCTETLQWLSTCSALNSGSGDGHDELDTVELEAMRKNVSNLREVVCDYIASIQQWSKVLNTTMPLQQSSEVTNID